MYVTRVFEGVFLPHAAYNPDDRPAFVEVVREMKTIMDQVAEKTRQRKSVTISIENGETSSPRGKIVSPRDAPSPVLPQRDRTPTAPYLVVSNVRRFCRVGLIVNMFFVGIVLSSMMPFDFMYASPSLFRKPKLGRAKSERVLVIKREDSIHQNGGSSLKGSRSLDSLFLTGINHLA